MLTIITSQRPRTILVIQGIGLCNVPRGSDSDRVRGVSDSLTPPSARARLIGPVETEASGRQAACTAANTNVQCNAIWYHLLMNDSVSNRVAATRHVPRAQMSHSMVVTNACIFHWIRFFLTQAVSKAGMRRWCVTRLE